MDSLYSRYASALLSLAKDEGRIKEYKDALLEVLSFFSANLETKKYLESYLIPNDAKYEVADKISEPFKLAHLASFLKLLIKKHRFHSFKEIVYEYVKIANEELGILEGFVYSTITLTNEEVKRISKSISKNIGQQVELKPLIDTRLIGGIKVVVRDRVFDGSILGKLNSLKTNLTERSKE